MPVSPCPPPLLTTSLQNLDTLFPHHLGHYIGLDVHDSPGYSRKDNLKTGQCITIEPGIYVPNDERWPEHFRGIGIRIEDSICIQEETPLILTTEAVKEVVDIEDLRQP
jgi:intermediate cleaving peptidase 55